MKVVFFDIGETLVHKVDDGTRILVDGAFDAVQAFKEHGALAGVISNTGNLTRDQLDALLPSGFDFNIFEATLVILSSDPDVNVEKPDPAIYQLAFDRARLLIPTLDPNQCLYCGENLVEVMAAQFAGFLGARVLLTGGGTELTGLPQVFV